MGGEKGRSFLVGSKRLQYRTAAVLQLYCTAGVLFCTVLYCRWTVCTILYCRWTVCTILYCRCTVCTVLYCRCTILYCTVLQVDCTAQRTGSGHGQRCSELARAQAKVPPCRYCSAGCSHTWYIAPCRVASSGPGAGRETSLSPGSRLPVHIRDPTGTSPAGRHTLLSTQPCSRRFCCLCCAVLCWRCRRLLVGLCTHPWREHENTLDSIVPRTLPPPARPVL